MMQRLSRSQIWIETQDIKTKALSDNLRKVREKKGISEKVRSTVCGTRMKEIMREKRKLLQ